MEGSSRVFSESHMANALLKNERISCTSNHQLPWVSNSPPSSFLGSSSMVNFEGFRSEKDSEMPFFSRIEGTKVDSGNEENDGCFLGQPEKKRRLLPDQVLFLEKSFDLENKLEPERKAQLAKELGLQPRQISIWFQNRRARCKTKLLEKDFDSLRSSYDRLKADYDTLCKENEKLQNEVHLLKDRITSKVVLELQQKKSMFAPAVVVCKPEDAASTARSDDSNSPRYTDGFFDPADPSDFSQDEDDSLNRGLLTTSPLLFYPKIEIESCCDDLQPNSCNLGFPVQDQGTGFWQF